jgi:RNA polymerase sigma-70 factor (ECF subfamily)
MVARTNKKGPKGRGSNRQEETELMSRFTAGDEDAFRDILNKYKDGLYSFLMRFLNQRDLVEDVFQETFLQLYTSRSSFDTSRPIRPWLFTIAANKARDALRKQQRTSTASFGTISEATDMSIDDVVNTLTSFEITPYEEVEKGETADMVRQVIADMPENLRGILLLAYFDQFSYKQMAEILSIPIGTVKSRLHAAVVYFTKRWRQDFEQRK